MNLNDKKDRKLSGSKSGDFAQRELATNKMSKISKKRKFNKIEHKNSVILDFSLKH